MAEESMQIRYLKNNPNFLKSYKLNSSVISSVDQKTSTIKRNCCGCKQLEDKPLNEKQLWVPKDAFQFAFMISQRYNKKLNEEIIEELLFGLNQIWSNREKGNVDKIKKQYERENKDLKKQLNKNLTYDEVQAKKKIQRLKLELSRTRKENEFSVMNTTNTLILIRPFCIFDCRGRKFVKQNFPLCIQTNFYTAILNKFQKSFFENPFDFYINNRNSRGNSLNGTSSTHQCKEKIIYFQDAIKLFQEYESDLRLCKEELQETKAKMKQQEDDMVIYDKVIYMEGAQWMIEKIITETNKIKQNSFNTLNQYQLDLEKILISFSNNIEEFEPNTILKLTKNILASHQNMNQALHDKFLNLKETTSKQIEKNSKIQQKLKKQKRVEQNNQSNSNKHQSENHQSNQQQYVDQENDYDREQIHSSSIISYNNYSNSYNKHQYPHSNQLESNSNTQRISNQIPQAYNAQSIYSTIQNQNNYLSEDNKSYNNQIDYSSYRQNNHISSNSTPIQQQQYYSQHSNHPNSRSKEILEDSFNDIILQLFIIIIHSIDQRPLRDKN